MVQAKWGLTTGSKSLEGGSHVVNNKLEMNKNTHCRADILGLYYPLCVFYLGCVLAFSKLFK